MTVAELAVDQQPQSQTKNYNEAVTFTATITGTASPFIYAWKKNGVDVDVGGSGGRIVQTDIGTQTSLTINNLVFADAASYSVVVTDNSSSTATSSTATLGVNDPYIATALSNQTNNAGTTSTFQVSALGSTALSCVWKTNNVQVVDGTTAWGSTISGATTDALTIQNVSASDVMTYTVTASGTGIGPDAQSSASLSVVRITADPISRTVNIGDKVVFAGSATGASPLTYQWQKDGGDISGATTNNYIIASAQTSDSGSYSLRITYPGGSIDTASAVLTVSESRLQLSSANLVVARVGDGAQTLRDSGNSIYLDQVTPAGSYVNTIAIPDSGTSSIVARGINGDTINSLNGMTTLTKSADGKYLVVNGYRLAYDPNATLALGGTSDTSNPRAVCTVNGLSRYSMGIQSAAAFSGANYRCGTFDGTNEFWGAGSGAVVYYFGTQATAGAVGSISNVRVVNVFNGSLYFCAANNGIYHFTGMPHVGDVTQTQDLTVSTSGGSGACDFAVSADGNTIYIADGRSYVAGSPTATIGGIQKWEKSGGVFGSAPTRILKPDPSSNVGALYLTVDFGGVDPIVYATTIGASQNKIVKIVDDGSNDGAGTTTLLATAGPGQQYRGIRFGPTSEAPTITSISANQTNNYGENFTMTVAANGTAPLAYQWDRNGGSPLSTSINLALTSLTYADQGTYNVQVTNELGSAAGTVLLTVNDPYIQTAVQDQVSAPGLSATFTVTAPGSGSLTYVWKKGETVLTEGAKYVGATSSSLTIQTIEVADAGSYTVVVSGSGPSVESTGALSVVNPVVLTHPSSATKNFGETATFQVVAAGDPAPTIQWKKDNVTLNDGPSASGATISGATTAILTITGVAYQDAGSYLAVASNGAGPDVSSDAAVLTVVDPVITSDPSVAYAFPGGSANFVVGASGSASLTYQWQKDGINLSDGTQGSGMVVAGATAASLICL